MEKSIPVLNPEEDWIDYFRFDIYVDCLLGTGFRGTPREPAASVIREINENRKRYDERFVISVDINSGMNGDTGEAELAVESNLTVSIGAFKKGLLENHARELIGKLVNVDIGIDTAYLQR
jgi:NAD(P)H-hydrate epimerase